MVQPLWIEQSSSALQADVSTSFTKVALIKIAEGFKPSTNAFVGQRSIQLSYATIFCYKNKVLPYQMGNI